MANRIFKYQLEIEQRQLVYMPANAQIISGRVENDFPHIYALVSEDELLPAEPRIIRVVTTGEKFEADGCEFVATLVIKDWFVCHIFEQVKPSSDPREPRFQGDYEQLRQELRA
jgi:hypothetical protein